MEAFQVITVLATLLCSLVAGFLFAFAVVIMPGIRDLSDRDYLRAFQVIDRVIQRNQPVFMLVWVGSVLAILASAVLGLWRLDGIERVALIIAMLAYVLGVQLPTFAINVPLNNRVQALDIDGESEAVLSGLRQEYEQRWNRWNRIRTGIAVLVSAALIVLCYSL